MPTFHEFAAMAASGAPPLDQIHKDATSKEYDVTVRMSVVETIGQKPYFDSGNLTWHGTGYGFMVAVQALLIEDLKKTNQLGGVVAIGEMPPLPPPAK